MRVIFRADASVTQGSGHLMRCLTLAEEFDRRGHDVVFASAVESIPWLEEHLLSTEYGRIPVKADRLDQQALIAGGADWVIVDSYRIDAGEISRLSDAVPVLAIVDGETRGIDATIYLDQNLGSDLLSWPNPERMLAGARFALVRDAFLAQRRAKPSQITGVPVVTAFMGGTDPGGVIVQVVGEIAGLGAPFDLTVVAPASHHAGVTELFPTARVIEPTPELPALLGSSDVIVSAAGTSAWDVCTLAIPALFVGVVDNQSASLVRLVEGGYALGVDLAAGGSIDSVGPAVTRLLADTALREELSKRCESQFDGLGKARVVDALTAATESANAARLPR